MTENEILRRFPNASRAFIEANLANEGTPASIHQSSLIADAFEQNARTMLGSGTNYARELKAEWITPLTPQEPPKEAPKNARAGQWFEIGGKRFFSRSQWERNYACYIQFLKEHGYIKEWVYEPKTFWFEGIRRGTNNYKPDFLVTFPDDTTEYREVKGYLDRKSKTKLKRMKKYFPDVKVRLIDSAWFKQHGSKMALIVPGWRKKK